ncbi:PCMD domain-containing protein [Sphingobacterium paucimobilis]|uniref:Putative carbohydrate metabolism domain-containing protein n=1 Tax=Sphingobacterium paucimobilis HER1398 TaxID=1346330 RepID=U2HH93_9SPHI|nr:PCMD domain-containing protein [Sphingobacterium paucimobilis]ERJ61111.1 hypothetical protein M472_20380 [Sphingobacterium paucimobilis HER1398]
MKLRGLLFFYGALLLFLSSCIKDEAPNMEADIIKAETENDVFLLEPVVSGGSIVLYLKPDQEETLEFDIKFTLTEGAQLQAEDGQVMDNNVLKVDRELAERMQTEGVSVKTISQDKQYSKQYLLKIINTKDGFVPTEYGFEEIVINKDQQYTEFFNRIDNQDFYNWSSGNIGYSLSLMFGGGKLEPDAYPTTTTTDAYSGERALLLETKATADFVAKLKKPIAAGNLFIGAFDTGPVLTDALSATQFGLPFNKVPAALEGYYKYQPADKVTDENMNPVNMKDSCDIYAVFYNRKQLMESVSDPKKKVPYLTGHNILTDPSIVAIAKIKDGSATTGDGFVKFSLPFEYRTKVDMGAVAGLDYNIAIVMSSSKRGDSFIGAVGSKLIVDDLKIVTK